MSFRYVSIHGIRYATADADFVSEDTQEVLEGQLLETQMRHILNAHFHIRTENEWGLSLPKHCLVDELVKRHDILNDPVWSMKHCSECKTCKSMGVCPRVISGYKSSSVQYEKDYNKPTYRNIGGKEGVDIVIDLEPTVVVVEETTLENIRRQHERKLKKQRRRVAEKAEGEDMTESMKRATLGAITLREYPWGALNACYGCSVAVYRVNPLLLLLFHTVKIPSSPSHKLSKYLKPLADIVRTTYTEVIGKQSIVQHDTALFTAATTDKHIPALFKELAMKPSTVSHLHHLYAVLFSAFVMNGAYRPYPFLKHSFTGQIPLDDGKDYSDIDVAATETVQYASKDVRHVLFSMEGDLLRKFIAPPPSDTKARSNMNLFCDICNEYGHDSTYEFHRSHDIRIVRQIRADVVEAGNVAVRRIHEYEIYDEHTEYLAVYVPRSIRRFHKRTQTFEDYEPPIRVVYPERLENDLELVGVVTDDRHLYFRDVGGDDSKTWYHYHGEFSPTLDTSFYKKVGSYANLMTTANGAVGRRGSLALFLKKRNQKR